MRVECVIIVFSNRYIGEALTSIESKEYFEESNYYRVTIPFELNVLLAKLVFKNDWIELEIDMHIATALRVLFSPLNPSERLKIAHVIVRKNGIIVVNKQFEDLPLVEIIKFIDHVDMKARQVLYGHECMKDSEIYINCISSIMDLGGEKNYQGNIPELSRQLSLAKQGNHPCPTALRGMSI